MKATTLNAQAAIASGLPHHDVDCPARCKAHECNKPPGKCKCPLANAREVRAAAVELLRQARDVEWAGHHHREGDAECPSCGAWVCTGRKHEAGCALDAAIVATAKALGVP